ncbi:Aste57867_16008 [Aphanomyces stellatus]|uniref:Aste57867_16008 protein n=1 Tax=Aphanomyces stellatus TaxID=120398 RepID=A0A485L4M4_9STRA|nr:hypothetical protein As57867_015952 [Aphanomyces stellatus]VFT92793.1 Aste57867_16008 [Aphanomyces stellatus]
MSVRLSNTAAAHSFISMHDYSIDAALVHSLKGRQLVADIEMAKAAAAARKLVQKKATRRNQSKLNQRRYRAEQKQMTDELNGMVTALHTEVARLEGRVESLRLTIPVAMRTFEPETRVVTEYFRMLENGFKQQDGPVRALQTNFLTSTMREDLEFMGHIGLDKLFLQWNTFMSCFGSFRFEVGTVDAVAFSPDVVVHADTVIHLRITRQTIEMLFRHLLGNEPLTQRLIGQVLQLPVQTRFTFDKDLQVSRFDTHANMALALSNLLGDIGDTLTALSQCRMRESTEIITLDDDNVEQP